MSVQLFSSSFNSGTILNSAQPWILGSAIPSSGSGGPSVLANDSEIESTDEVRAIAETFPAIGTLQFYVDGSGVYDGPGEESFDYRIFINGADAGQATVTFGVGDYSLSGVLPLNIAISSGMQYAFDVALAGSIPISMVPASAMHATINASIIGNIPINISIRANVGQLGLYHSGFLAGIGRMMN